MENISHDGDRRNQSLGAPNPDNIPDELKSENSWVVWLYEQRGGKPTKVPKVATTSGIYGASHSDPKTWRSFDEAIAAYKTGRFAGIGRVFVAGGGFVGIDIDDCRNLETGEFTPYAEGVLAFFDSYAEISPSLTGVKIWVRADLTRARRRGGLEIYPSHRFFTVTGVFVPGVPPTTESRQDELDAFIAAEFPRPKRRTTTGGGIRPKLDLLKFLEDKGVTVLQEMHDESAEIKYGIVCPWVSEHTGGDESGTRVGQYKDGANWFRCEHSHCEDRGWTEFRNEVDPRVEGFRRDVTVYRSSREVAV